MKRNSRLLVLLYAAMPLFAWASDKNTIEFESGKSAKDCITYNQLRAEERLRETSYNMLVAGEYLECSLAFVISDSEIPKTLLKSALAELRVRQLLLSIAQMAHRKDKLEKWFTLQQPTMAVFSQDDHHISIEVKGKLAENEYLIWVSDEILDASYRAYYPAVIVEEAAGLRVQSLYQSGF